MVNWIIVIAGIGALIVLLKAKDVKNKLFFFILITGLIFIAITFPTGTELDFTTFKGIFSAVKLYFSWLAQLAKSMVTVTGNAIKSDFISNITQ